MPSTAPHQPRCLIIDDHPDAVALLVSYLKDQGLDLCIAMGSEDGFSKAVKAQPDLILLDVGLPGVDGFSLCELLKADERTRKIPVIFLSGFTSLADKLKGFAVGGVDYITKPFFEAEVLARVRVHLPIWSVPKPSDSVPRVLGGMQNLPATEDVLLTRAIRLLETRLSDPPNLAPLALELGTNERKLNAVFRRRTGVTVPEFLQEMRMETARRLLEESLLQIQVIATRVGYQNAGDLTRAFKRRFGTSPRAYRQVRNIELDEQSRAG